MLEQPRSHDVGSEFRENAAFFLMFMSVRFGILVGRTVTRPDTVVETVTCRHEAIKEILTTFSQDISHVTFRRL